MDLGCCMSRQGYSSSAHPPYPFLLIIVTVTTAILPGLISIGVTLDAVAEIYPQIAVFVVYLSLVVTGIAGIRSVSIGVAGLAVWRSTMTHGEGVRPIKAGRAPGAG